jgi:hypothetical protein
MVTQFHSLQCYTELGMKQGSESETMDQREGDFTDNSYCM